MAVQSDTSRIQYAGNNSTSTSYAVPFVFLENSHLKAIARTSAGVETVVTLTNHTGAGDVNGGTVRTAVAVPATSTLTIFREVPATQTTVYQEGGDFPAASHERALDKLTQISQQNQRQIGSSLRLSEATQIAPLPLPLASGQHVLATAGNGTAPSFQSLGSLSIGPVIATGSTTPRSVQDRFADVINVKDFGAVGDGVTDDTAAMQAAVDYAIDGASRRLLFMPAGNYVTSSAIVVRGELHIMGAGRSRTVVFANHNGDGVVFEPTGAGSQNVFLSNCKLSSISISRNTAGNGGSAVWLRQCNQFTAEDVGVANKNIGFRVTGGQLNLFNNIRCTNFSPFTQVLTAPAACFLFERADLGGGNFQPCYTVSINNITASANNLLPQCIRILSIDGLNINNGYFAFGWSSLIRFARQSTGDQITGVNISNCYFDAVDNVRDGVVVVPKCVHVAHDLGAAHEGCRQTRFSNCFFANNDGANEYLVTVQKFCELHFSNCSFGNASAEGFSVSDGANVGVAKGRYVLNGCLFKNLSELDAAGYAVFIKDAEHVAITGCMFYNTITPTSHIRLTGALVSGAVVGNVADPATTTLTTSSLTVSDKLIALNTSDHKVLLGLPTDSTGLPAGALYDNSGIVTVVGSPGRGSATYDPPSLNDGDGATTTVTVTGAALGDYAAASFSLDLQGITLAAWVSAADTVSVLFQNETGGTINLGSGTLRARILKP